jgi:amino acid permease
VESDLSQETLDQVKEGETVQRDSEEDREEGEMTNESAPLINSSLEGDSLGDSQNYASINSCQNGEEIVIETQDTDGTRHRLQISNEDKPMKTIGMIGSFTLLVNNLTGPGMLGFPSLFQKAGLIPVLCGISFVCISASLCGTFLADSIASIPNNHNFDMQVDFSSAFRYTVGEEWYVVAETLFLISCFVQAIAGIVSTAQSLDGFIASFLFGRTYAFEFYPNFGIISWTPELCHEETSVSVESNLDDCTPFHNAGSLIFTVGFVITALIFIPLGLGHLKETIIIQIISFIFMIVLLFQFSGEFAHRGLRYELPLVGNEVSQLAGVILFNYAFSITIPAWLNEKSNKVSINKVVWSSSILASVIYVIFGVMGAMAFDQVGPNILILLTSSKVKLCFFHCVFINIQFISF